MTKSWVALHIVNREPWIRTSASYTSDPSESIFSSIIANLHETTSSPQRATEKRIIDLWHFVQLKLQCLHMLLARIDAKCKLPISAYGIDDLRRWLQA